MSCPCGPWRSKQKPNTPTLDWLHPPTPVTTSNWLDKLDPTIGISGKADSAACHHLIVTVGSEVSERCRENTETFRWQLLPRHRLANMRKQLAELPSRRCFISHRAHPSTNSGYSYLYKHSGQPSSAPRDGRGIRSRSRKTLCSFGGQLDDGRAHFSDRWQRPCASPSFPDIYTACEADVKEVPPPQAHNMLLRWLGHIITKLVPSQGATASTSAHLAECHSISSEVRKGGAAFAYVRRHLRPAISPPHHGAPHHRRILPLGNFSSSTSAPLAVRNYSVGL